MTRSVRFGSLAAAAAFAAACAAGCSGNVGTTPGGGAGGNGGSGGGGSAGGDADAGASTDGRGTTPYDKPGPGGGDDPPPPPPYEAVAPHSYAAKVKMLMTGRPVTADELRTIVADPAALRGLIDGWMADPAFAEKMLVFFGNAFQQAQITPTSLVDQLVSNVRGERTAVARLMLNIQESFPRTVWQMVAEGRPLNQAITTQTFMLTPALAALLGFLDDRHIDDKGVISHRTVQQIRGFSFTVQNADGPIPLEQTLDPASPNFMKWHISMPFPNCTITHRVFANRVAPLALWDVLMGYVNDDASEPDPTICRQFQTTPQFTPEDFTTWRAVAIRAPKAGETPTRFYDLPTLRTANELVLTVPRVGFFSTPAFFANWATNTSNQSRVTMNQALIVALGRSFDDANVTVPVSETALDKEHAAPDTACYGCHRALDPMRQYFTQAYTLPYRDQREAAKQAQEGVFAFDGVTGSGGGLDELARLLSEHPRFALAWAQKLCFYANSAGCSEDDPELVRVSDAFRASRHDFKTLVRELFSSPLVTGAAPTKTFTDRGVVVSITRRDHLCVALSNRLGLPDVCGISGMPGLTPLQTRASVLSTSLPEDSYSRGAEAPVLGSDTSLFFRSVTENLCRHIAPQVVSPTAGTGKWTGQDPEAAFPDLVRTVMGLPDGDPRAAAAQQILRDHFGAARATGATATDALRSTFALACMSPSAVAVGL